MKKIAVITAVLALAVPPAHAISEAYRKQLEREHKTQQSQIADTEAVLARAHGKKFTGGDYNMFEVITDSHCRVKTINGFPPKRIESKHGKKIITAGTGDKFELNQKACRIGWLNDGEVIPLHQG